MVEKLVRNTIKKYNLLEKGDRVIIGLSGGPDSACLFFVLLGLADELDLCIKAVHVNHMLRPVDADKDQEYAEALCRDTGVVCDVSKDDCLRIAKERGVTTEEAGRNLRYEAFYRAAKALVDEGVPAEKIKIAVAQNKNDQAETMLMRIIRGTGVNGLSGIGFKRAGLYGTTVIRPLLDVTRADIELYCNENNIKPRIDHTNALPLYTRNKIRLELIPFIAEHFNENIVEALARLSLSAKEDNEYLRKLTDRAYKSVKKGKGECDIPVNADKTVIMDRGALRETDPAIRHRIVLAAFKEIGLAQDISSAHFDMIDGIILSENASAEVHLPGGYTMSVSYGDAIARLCTYEDIGGQIAGIAGISLISKVIPAGEFKDRETPGKSGMAAFDYGRLLSITENVTGGLAVRGRREGDRFTPAGMKTGSKKIQDYFVDRKIPKENRDHYRLVVLGGEVIWIFDPITGRHSEISEKYRVTADTKETLLLEIRYGL